MKRFVTSKASAVPPTDDDPSKDLGEPQLVDQAQAVSEEGVASSDAALQQHTQDEQGSDSQPHPVLQVDGESGNEALTQVSPASLPEAAPPLLSTVVATSTHERDLPLEFGDCGTSGGVVHAEERASALHNAKPPHPTAPKVAGASAFIDKWDMDSSSGSNDDDGFGGPPDGLAAQVPSRVQPIKVGHSHSHSTRSRSRSRSRSVTVKAPTRRDVGHAPTSGIIPQPCPTNDCHWWADPLWLAVGHLRQCLPLKQSSEYTSDHLCFGAGTDALVFQVFA